VSVLQLAVITPSVILQTDAKVFLFALVLAPVWDHRNNEINETLSGKSLV
jgi:hypothetical protein